MSYDRAITVFSQMDTCFGGILKLSVIGSTVVGVYKERLRLAVEKRAIAK
jgi:hypothetical protein